MRKQQTTFELFFSRFSMLFLVMALMSMSLFFTACQPDHLQPSPTPKVPPKGTIGGTTQDLQTLTTVEELRAYLDEHANSPNMMYRGFGGVVAEAAEMVMDDAGGAQTAFASSAPTTKVAGTDYSTTNVQVKGVDEADFVKTDGEYIYLVQDHQLIIAKAQPTDDASILETVELYGRSRNLFVNGDELIVFVENESEHIGLSAYNFRPQLMYTTQTHMLVFDITDRSNPELSANYHLEGNYFQSRMIGDIVYFVVTKGTHDYAFPVIRSSGDIVFTPEVYYFDNPENSYQFQTIASYDLSDNDFKADSYLLGYASTLYVSQENMYLAFQKQHRYDHTYYEDIFYDAIIDLLPSELRIELLALKTEDASFTEVSKAFDEGIRKLSQEDQNALFEKISKEVARYEEELERDRSKTILHKFSLNEGNVEHDAEGEVPGRLLNQFSLDEHEGNLRVATTLELWRSNQQDNNVYVLDEELDTIGELEGLAEGERIYSTRFMGDRLYMVTFKNIDPLFVIDLSSPRNPFVLGELKIPGFSDYLHPYGEDYLIGIGKDTENNRWGGVSTSGVKMALFDVSDVRNPKEIESIVLGGRGSHSEVSNDHKAFMLDLNRNLLVLPVQERDYGNGGRYYNDNAWYGAYVFSISEDGFEQETKISHGNDYPHTIRRSLYIDDILYTVSSDRIMFHDINGYDKLGSFRLPYSRGGYEIY